MDLSLRTVNNGLISGLLIMDPSRRDVNNDPSRRAVDPSRRAMNNGPISEGYEQWTYLGGL